MWYTIRRLWFCGVGFCWVLVCLLPAWLGGAEVRSPAAAQVMRGTDFVLTRQGDRFSLRAQQASLRDIVTTLGTMLAIEVVARIPPSTTVTLDMVGLSLHETLQRLRTFANIVSITETTHPASKITRIFVLPIHSALSNTPRTVPSSTAPPPPTGSRPEPFKFEFDPSKRRERQP